MTTSSSGSAASVQGVPRKQPLGRAVLDAASGVPLFAITPLRRRWHRHWGASDAEVDP